MPGVTVSEIIACSFEWLDSSMNNSNCLFTRFDAGQLALSHRVVLAPMTRTRADPDRLAPTAINAEYYAQRASQGGLLITEATHISPEATPIWTIYDRVRDSGGQVPGLWTEDQVAGWKLVTRAVHRQGARIVCQLLHTGRIAQAGIGRHPLVAGTNAPLPPVSSSATPMETDTESSGDYDWDREASTPRGLETDEIARVVADYRHAANNARRAGFDAVELHAAHGYLVDQFLCDGVNQRSDCYGGSIENRCRFLYEVVEALIDIMGAGRVGVRLSPTFVNPATGRQNQVYFAATCSDPDQIYSSAVAGLNNYALAYLLLTEPRVGGLSRPLEQETAYRHPLRNKKYRELFRGTLIGAGGFTPSTAAEAVENGHYDAVAFGRWFLSNPDLPSRIKKGADLTIYDRNTFYGGGEKGYTDYPAWQAIKGTVSRNYDLIEQDRIGASLNRSDKS
jgi:N-ethylmaleimide reductase